MTANDLTLYDRLSDTWWAPNGILHQLADFNPLRLAYVRELVGPLPGKRVLDLGCGGGLFSEALAAQGARVTGIDRSGASIAAARRHALEQDVAVDYQVADAATLPFADSSFDVVVASEVLEHLADVDGALKEAARVLVPGGLFIFDTPNRTWISRVALIGLGEWLLRQIPFGTHDGRLFLRPEEVGARLKRFGILQKEIRGFLWSGWDEKGRHRFRFSRTTALAYFGYGVRAR